MKILRSIDKAIAKAERFLLVAFLFMMVVLTFLNVTLRALHVHAHLQWANDLLGKIDWTEPFVRLLVLWVTFLGASLLTSANKHIKIDIISSLLPSRWVPVRELVLSMGCMTISALMLWSSLGYIKVEITYGARIFLGLPVWIGQLILPAGFFMILFRFFLRGADSVLDLAKGGRP